MLPTVDTTLLKRFAAGDPLTRQELEQTYYRMVGRPLPRRSDPAQVAQQLSSARPLRFEFEVNRLRGYAWEHENERAGN